jgi:hypothetical protein
MTIDELWRRGQAGWPRRFPLVQAPNPPLLAAIAGRRMASAATRGGRVHDVSRSLFTLGFTVWAWEEMTRGANWFRRLLGAAALLWVLAVREPRR